MGSRRSPPRIEGMVSLKVDNLAYRTTVDDLKRVFSRYGKVGDIYIPRDPFTFESRGFAFVRYFDERDADDAIDRLDGTNLDGRDLRVQMAKYTRPNAPQRRYQGGGGGGRRGGRSKSRSRSPRRRGGRSRSRSRSRDRRRSPSRESRSRSHSR